MFKPEDINQVVARGSQIDLVEQQIGNFKSGFPFLKLTEAASQYHGLIQLSEAEIEKYVAIFEKKVAEGIDLLKFVPASGAASRMFKSLFTALEDLQKGKGRSEVIKDKEVALFLEQLDRFAFYEDLQQLAAKENLSIEDVPLQKLLEWKLLTKGLNYGNLPKGLTPSRTIKILSHSTLCKRWRSAMMFCRA